MRGVSQLSTAALAAGLAVAGLAMSANAALIQSFENTGKPTSGSSYSTTTGVTDGSYSCAVPFNSGWQEVTLASAGSLSGVLNANPALKLDITVPADTDNNGWIAMNLIVQSDTGTGGSEKNGPTFFRSGLASGIGTTTMSWDLTSLNIPATAGWLNIKISCNGDRARTVYMDNLRAEPVPEPAALGLIGLASTALLRRRR